MTILPRFLAAAVLATVTVTGALAQTARVGPIEIDQAWTRATAPRAANGGAYLTIRNTGAQPDRLIAAASPAAGRAELHAHAMDDGVMRMRPVDAVALPPGGTVALAPGGLHVMLLGLHAALVEGATVPVTLTFEHAGSVTVKVPVMKAGAGGPATKPMNMPHDPAPHGAPVITPGGHVVRP